MTARASNPDKRLEVLDALRGFAVGGILLANVLWLSGYLLAPSSVRENLLLAHPLDELSLFLTRLWIHGKFYSIFSFLFGLGFAIQMLSTHTNAKPKFIAQYARRLLVLFLFGCAHAYFIWWGDILRFYALIGIFLLVFRRATDRTILAMACAAMLAPILLATLRDIGWLDPVAALSQGSKKAQSLVILSEGGWTRFRDYNLEKIVTHAVQNIESGRALKIFGLFLLGFYCGRSGVVQHIHSYRLSLKKIVIWCGLLGTAASLLRLAEVYGLYRGFKSESLDEVLYLMSVYPLAAAYIALFLLGVTHPGTRPWLNWLAPVGKMALTNYILQSIALAAVFYWWGLGLAGVLPLRFCYALTLLIFLAQTLFSAVWLSRFNFGPLEWVWRMLTRLEWVALRRSRGITTMPPSAANNSRQ